MELEQGDQVVKTRDDQGPAVLKRQTLSSDSPRKYLLADGDRRSWVEGTEPFEGETLRPRIEPWLTALCQSEHLSLLIGSGLTHAVHRLATTSTLPGMDTAPIGAFDEELAIEVARSAKAAGREPGNIEDQIRSATELLRGLEILCADPNSEHSRMLPIDALRHGLTACLTNFVASILHGERNILEANAQQREMAFNYLINFLMSFASRSGTRERLNIYTTNYDRFLELGADLAGLRLIDRFVGTLAPVFRTSRLDVDFHYNPPGIRGEPRYLEGVARFTKLHGSIDWLDDDGAIRRLSLPFGTEDVTPFLARPARQSTDARQLMIYPNAAKDRETSFFPYAELFRDFATSICRPNSTLVSYGYSFGDEHINRVIADMLTIPSSHLVIIAYSDPLRRIINTYEELGRPSQVTLLLGDHVADLRTLVDLYLPKSAIDRTTSRMAELLRSRLGTEQVGNTAYDSEADLEATHVDEGGER